MKLMPRYNFAIRYFMVFSAIISVLLLVVLNAIAISGEKDNPRSGNAIGIIQDEYKKPLWIVSGNWLNNLSNQTQTTNNSKFNMSFDMINIDGTSQFNSTTTNFAVTNISTQNNNNNTIFTGTGMIIIPPYGAVNSSLTIHLMKNNFGIFYISMINAPKGPGPVGPPT